MTHSHADGISAIGKSAGGIDRFAKLAEADPSIARYVDRNEVTPQITALARKRYPSLKADQAFAKLFLRAGRR
jgi:hypothetical protein